MIETFLDEDASLASDPMREVVQRCFLFNYHQPPVIFAKGLSRCLTNTVDNVFKNYKVNILGEHAPAVSAAKI